MQIILKLRLHTGQHCLRNPIHITEVADKAVLVCYWVHFSVTGRPLQNIGFIKWRSELRYISSKFTRKISKSRRAAFDIPCTRPLQGKFTDRSYLDKT